METTPLEELWLKSKKQAKIHKTLYSKLKRQKPGQADQMFQEAHEEVFACTDCMKCANCCYTTGPKFSKHDIKRIAKYVGMKPAKFELTYLRFDEDEDLVLKQTPCAFLDTDDNSCTIYDVRPSACASYPHTEERNQVKLEEITLTNATICPAVYDILEKVSEKIALNAKPKPFS